MLRVPQEIHVLGHLATHRPRCCLLCGQPRKSGWPFLFEEQVTPLDQTQIEATFWCVPFSVVEAFLVHLS